MSVKTTDVIRLLAERPAISAIFERLWFARPMGPSLVSMVVLPAWPTYEETMNNLGPMFRCTTFGEELRFLRHQYPVVRQTIADYVCGNGHNPTVLTSTLIRIPDGARPEEYEIDLDGRKIYLRDISDCYGTQRILLPEDGVFGHRDTETRSDLPIRTKPYTCHDHVAHFRMDRALPEENADLVLTIGMRPCYNALCHYIEAVSTRHESPDYHVRPVRVGYSEPTKES